MGLVWQKRSVKGECRQVKGLQDKDLKVVEFAKNFCFFSEIMHSESLGDFRYAYSCGPLTVPFVTRRVSQGFFACPSLTLPLRVPR